MKADPYMCLQLWRACVGRMPLGFEARFSALCRRFPRDRVERTIGDVGRSDLRRTKDRWALFLAFFGEAP